MAFWFLYENPILLRVASISIWKSVKSAYQRCGYFWGALTFVYDGRNVREKIRYFGHIRDGYDKDGGWRLLW